MKPLIGNIYVHLETGTEGPAWAFTEDEKTGWDAVHIVSDGDFLQIIDDNETVWNDNINYQHDKYHHGIPFNVEFDQWYELFFKECKAKLIKADMGHFCYGGITSSIIAGYSYDKGNLFLKFKNGDFYKYESVPENVYVEFYSAESMGSYFHANIKNKYKTEKVILPKL